MNSGYQKIGGIEDHYRALQDFQLFYFLDETNYTK